jgi:hypothetical protein
MTTEQVRAAFVGRQEDPLFMAIRGVIAGFRESEIQTTIDVTNRTPDERTAAAGGIDVLDRLHRDLVMRVEEANKKAQA